MWTRGDIQFFMKCIEAIEGTCKSIIRRLYLNYLEEHLDDTEYIGNVRSVLEGLDGFVSGNREAVDDPAVLKNVLYEFARDQWLKGLDDSERFQQALPEKESEEGYPVYYYDHIYSKGNYPL
jgi:hypothetical protein